jgi:hypothetical protein
MIDLAQHFELAQRYSDNWSPSNTLEALQAVARAVTGSSVDLDIGAGEKWGRVLVGDRTLLLVCCLLPIAIVDRSIENTFHSATNARVRPIVVDNMDQKSFAVDHEELERVFQREMSPNLDYSSMSANELWWATV